MKKSLETLCVKENYTDAKTQSHVAPIHATSAFTYSSIQDSIDVFTGKAEGHVYTRYGNPTIQAIEKKLAACEGYGINEETYALLTNSGLSAISTLVFALCKQGDAVLTQHGLYGGTTELMKKQFEKAGIDIIFTDLKDLDATADILKKNGKIKLIYMETPTNPTLDIVDIRGLAQLGHAAGIETAIDNTFSTFYLQEPMTHGIDYVIYSATKYLNGHGNALTGAIICKGAESRMKIWESMKLLGTNSNAWEAWLLSNGIKTLALRMDKHCANAQSLAELLNNHSKVKKVNYPGLENHVGHSIAKKQMKKYGGMLSFEIDGKLEDAIRFMDNCQMGSITATLGNVDTLLLHPATSSHLNIPEDIRQRVGISDGLIRVSVGIENVDDLLSDFSATLDAL